MQEVLANQVDIKESLLSAIPELSSVYDNIPPQEVIEVLDYLKNPVIVLRRRFTNSVVEEEFTRVAISCVRGDLKGCPDATIAYEGIDSRISDSQRTYYNDLLRGGRFDNGSQTSGELYELVGRLSDINSSQYPATFIPFSSDIERLEVIKRKITTS